MQAVARSSSEEVLRSVDELISEGQNPTHFARQLVRFLRNATVAKVAGKDSSLLQISGDERERVARVAELFSEEDLARHLQIMLRTHGELGYRQEQRFHLELGLLKMAHAQRLLPIEELLSGAALPSAPSAHPAARPSVVGGNEPRRTEAGRGAVVSPFAADSARKNKPEMSAEPAPGPRAVPNATAVVMGSAAPAVQQIAASAGTATGRAVETQPITERQPLSEVELKNSVLNALSGQPMLIAMLEAGEWRVEGGDVVVKVTASQVVIDMSVSAEAKRMAAAAASGVLGRAVKMRVVPGGTAQASPAPRSNGGGRTKAEQDPLVRKMQETFGAEIRTIIDYTKKG